MHTRICCLLLTAGMLSASPALRAQTPVIVTTPPVVLNPAPPVAPNPAPPGTLAGALTEAQRPDGIALAVGAESVRLPPNAAAPGAVAQVADASGRLERHFGDVTAVAPPAMTVLYVPPADMNPFEGMPAEDALNLLAASLSPAQWQALTGEHGLGLSDLDTDDQRALFLAALPRAPVTVNRQKTTVSGNAYTVSYTDQHDVTADLPPSGAAAPSAEAPCPAPTRRPIS